MLQVEAGAVGCALGLALALIGVDGPWVVVDGDLVDVSNLNRQLLFLARDAGTFAEPARNKAETFAGVLRGGFQASPYWYGDDASVQDETYDVVLALANEDGVRASLQSRHPTVLLHATTSPN